MLFMNIHAPISLPEMLKNTEKALEMWQKALKLNESNAELIKKTDQAKNEIK